MSKKIRVITLSGNDKANIVMYSKFKDGSVKLYIYPSTGDHKPGDVTNHEYSKKDAIGIIKFSTQSSMELFIKHLQNARDMFVRNEGGKLGYEQGKTDMLTMISRLTNTSQASLLLSIKKMENVINEGDRVLNSLTSLVTGEQEEQLGRNEEPDIKDKIKGHIRKRPPVGIRKEAESVE